MVVVFVCFVFVVGGRRCVVVALALVLVVALLPFRIGSVSSVDEDVEEDEDAVVASDDAVASIRSAESSPARVK